MDDEDYGIYSWFAFSVDPHAATASGCQAVLGLGSGRISVRCLMVKDQKIVSIRQL